MDLLTTYGFLATATVLSCFVCCLLACFLIVAPSDRRTANIYLAVFLILTAVDMSGWISPGLDSTWAWLEVLRIDLAYLQMPFFTAFVLGTLYRDFRPGRTAWLHILPFFVALVLALPGNQLSLFQNAQGEDASRLLTDIELILTVTGLHLQYYVYIAVSAWGLYRFERLHRQQHSGSLPTVYRVLMQLVVLSVLLHTLVFIRSFAGFGGHTALFTLLAVSGAVLVLGVLTWLTLIALLHPDMFRRVDRSLEAARLDRNAADQARDDQVARAQLEAYMKAKQPYLEPDISLAGLAHGMAMTPRELSGLINRAFSVHFFDFVNRYRVEYAKDMLLAAPRKTVLEVAFASGFNSKSSFNAAFRRHAVMSPTEFRAARSTSKLAG